MKKIAFFAFAFLTGLLVIGSQSKFTVFSAKNENQTIDNAQDRRLATTIRNLTNRSIEGLPEKKTAHGVSIDLDSRFQNVMLSKIEADGEPAAACVTSVAEANEFLGRNLDTGEIIFSEVFEKNDAATVAARHGMSNGEFEFYKKLIEEAIIRRSASPNAATLNIVNNDGADEGFNDPAAATPEGGNTGATRGAQRLNLFNFAAGIWGAYLDTNVAINVNSQFNSQTPCSSSGGVLGSAGTTTIFRNFSGAQFSNTWYHVALANKRAGTDLNNQTAEINATFNSDVDNSCLGGTSRFYYGLDNLTPANRINLLVVLLHEMGHGLGFSSFVNGSTGALNGGFPDIYTRYMFDRNVNKYWYEMTNAERQTSALNSNNVLWDGANVRAASSFLTNGRDAATGGVLLFTPTTFAGGSSISHWSTAASPNLLMEPNISVGLPLNLDLTRQQMRDIGWFRDTTLDQIPDTISDVPPSGGTLIIGSNINITWTNTGGFDRAVTIELSTDGGTTYPTTIAANVANTGSYNFTVPNITALRSGKIRVRENGFVDPSGASSSNFSIGTTVVPNRTWFDFDGDGKADVSVFRPENGSWYLQQTANGFAGVQFGAATDKIVPADYDGDGRTDVAVFRGGTWYLNRTQSGLTGVAFGAASDVPVPADFDGDGRAELAVYRPGNGTWYIYNLFTNQNSSVFFGASEDKPIVADFDGDGRADVAVFRPSNGTWYLQRSQLGFIGVQFGDQSDKPTPADFDGDGKTDIAVYRPSNGTWYQQRSRLGFVGVAFGTVNDIPAAADYDGDGKTDIAVFRPSNGTWYLNRTQSGFTGVAFGAANDRPAPSAFVP